MKINQPWNLFEKSAPGCRDAWERMTQPLPSEAFVFGFSGRPITLKAIDSGCYDWTYTGCRCREFVGGQWLKRTPCKRGDTTAGGQ